MDRDLLKLRQLVQEWQRLSNLELIELNRRRYEQRRQARRMTQQALETARRR
jgi:hypothetical protein